MTAHIKAKKEDFAKIVLMPGDPIRAKWIAETFLKKISIVNDVRGMLGYTGFYNGTRVSVMGHGMGIPSMGIYSYELFNFFEVDCILRIGSAGSYSKDINVGDLLLVKKSFSESTYEKVMNAKPIEKKCFFSKFKKTNLGTKLSPINSINEEIKKVAAKNEIKIKEVNVHTSDVFYGKRSLNETIKISESDVVDMECFALFANANLFNKEAGCLLTCSDSLVTNEQMSAQERETTFTNMVKLALEFSKEYIDNKIIEE